MYEIVLSKKFDKELKKSIRNNPKLWKKVGKTLRLMSNDIKHPSLKLHKLSGGNNWSVSVSKSYRLIFNIFEDKIMCIKFGTHEEVYSF